MLGAGTYTPVAVDKIDPALFSHMMETNYMGVVNCVSALVPGMIARGQGHLSWIASVAGYMGLPKSAAYGPTKAALINLAESLAPEMGVKGVSVSVINPGFVETPLTAQNDFPMPFLMKAVTQALQEHPKVNSSVEGEAIRYHDRVNLGVAVALDWGLLVPVVQGAEDLSLSGLARAVNDLSSRARARKLQPQEVQGGTFTITNPGVFGSLFGTPILNQPQVAILCVGAIQKRVVVLDDEEETLGVRSMAFLALSFDHRVLDGADADRFMARVKHLLETFPEEAL